MYEKWIQLALTLALLLLFPTQKNLLAQEVPPKPEKQQPPKSPPSEPKPPASSPENTPPSESEPSTSSPGKAPPKGANRSEPTYKLNLGLYYRVDWPDSGRQFMVPFFDSSYDQSRQMNQFRLWPLLSGYYTDQQSDYWYSFPLFTVAGTLQRPDLRVSGFASLPLLTFQYEVEQESRNQRSSQWFCLPLLSLVSKQSGPRGTVHIEEMTWASPFLHDFEQSLSAKKDGKNKKLQIEKLELAPLHFLLSRGRAQYDLSIISDARWQNDRRFRLFQTLDLSVIEFHKRYNPRFPGYEISKLQQRVRDIQGERALKVDEIPFDSQGTPTTHFGFLDPFFSVESNANGYQRIEWMPFFSHTSDSKSSRWAIPFMFMEIEDGKPHFRPIRALQKSFPLAYHDENSGRTDVLWPLISWAQLPEIDQTDFRIRFLVDYQQRQDLLQLQMGMGMLYNHQAGPGGHKKDVLGGLLFSDIEHKSRSFRRWDILKGFLFGYEERADHDVVEIFRFFRFKTRTDKKAATPPKKTE